MSGLFDDPPKGSVVKEPAIEAEVVTDDMSLAYAEMDRRDEELIVKSYTGQSVDTMTYSLPYKNDYGKEDWGVKGCKYCRDKIKHVHVCGISIHGVNQLVNMMGGIKIKIVSNIRKMIDGQYFWVAEAVAQDAFNMIERSASAQAKCKGASKDVNDPRGDFSQRIAESLAERNAARKVLPQLALDAIKQLAEAGQTSFTEEDVTRIITPFMRERRALKQQYFNALIGGGGGVMRMEEPAPRQALPVTEEPQEEPPPPPPLQPSTPFDETTEAPCEECGKPMVEKKNKAKGTTFIACSGYPKCKNTRNKSIKKAPESAPKPSSATKMDQDLRYPDASYDAALGKAWGATLTLAEQKGYKSWEKLSMDAADAGCFDMLYSAPENVKEADWRRLYKWLEGK